ncbi:MAG: glycosyltransferase family 2 protein [Acidimicrobiales bacterium]
MAAAAPTTDEVAVVLVAVIVVGHDSARWLPECFTTLGSSSYRNTLVLFVDNASTDGSCELVTRSFPAVRVRRNTGNLGFAGACNIAIREALAEGARYVFLVNPDTRTPAHLVAGLVTFMEHNTWCGISGPLQNAYGAGWATEDELLNDWSRAAITAAGRHVFHLWRDDWSPLRPLPPPGASVVHHSYVQGAALFARASVLSEVGLLDELYHSFYEELDLCRRARTAGHGVVLLPGLRIEHAGDSTGPPSAYRRRHMARNRYLYLLTEPAGRRAVTAVAARWLSADVASAFRGTGTMVTNPKELATMVGWLVGHAPALWARRRSSMQSRSSGSPGRSRR